MLTEINIIVHDLIKFSILKFAYTCTNTFTMEIIISGLSIVLENRRVAQSESLIRHHSSWWKYKVPVGSTKMPVYLPSATDTTV